METFQTYVKYEQEMKRKVKTTIRVEMCQIQREKGNILPILQVYSALVKKVKTWLNPPQLCQKNKKLANPTSHSKAIH